MIQYNNLHRVCINISFPVLSAVFNALVLFCIRDIHVALQKMLNLKADKDQKKYEVNVTSADLTSCLSVAVERWFTPHSVSFVLFSG